MKKQKEKFLEGEGDKWLHRNKSKLKERDYEEDLIINEIKYIRKFFNKDYSLKELSSSKVRILEIGCGDASRLKYIQNNFNYSCYGIEPSSAAVELGRSRGLNITQGTADRLNYENDYFDIIIFGFCLYLCDREDLFSICFESDRVLKNKGFIIILDFYSDDKIEFNKYKHKDGIRSYKMDYSKMFTWNPFYTAYRNKILHHIEKEMTDESYEWISISTIRKNSELIEK
tara:strand:+ start:1447 stop:2133 length:687 start_codon:yes stop_codon:yes gene_type:complete